MLWGWAPGPGTVEAMTQTMTVTDTNLKALVADELRWTPAVDATKIGVAVNGGAVTLSGTVPSYPEKVLAGKAALRVRGVSALAQELTVHSEWARTDDADIAGEVVDALRRSVDVPSSVQATVAQHAVTLTGEVEWHFQRVAATHAVRSLRGVTGVVDAMTIRPRVHAGDVRHEITQALARNAALEGSHISVVVVSEGTVRLDGTVRFWAERHQAEHAAWAAAGVHSVINHLRIER